MALKPETVFKHRIAPILRKIPGSWWVKIQQKAIRGSPDFLGVICGKMVALELKKDRYANIGTLQLYTLRLIKNAGGYAEIVYPENFEFILEELKNISHPS